MGVLDKIVDFVVGKPVTKDDPIFGRLEFNKRRNEWNGLEDFSLGNDKLRVSVEAGPDGPTAVQRELIAEFAKRWPDLKQQITPLAFAELKGWFDGGREWSRKNDPNGVAIIPELRIIDEVWKYLTLSYVRVSLSPEPKGDFDVGIEFSYLNGIEDPEHSMHAFVRDWCVTYVQIEG